MNVLNTVWDLFLAEPYRDGGSGLNGYDMHGLRTAVHVDGSINDPSAENKGWSVEVVIPFSALYEYQKERRAPKNGEFYRMNFSRVQWNVDVKDNTYVKRTDENGNVLPEDNWVWAPTGVINIHYPELWAFVFFSEDREEAPFRRTSIANGSSASCITQKIFCLRQPAPTAAASMNCRKRWMRMHRTTGINL